MRDGWVPQIFRPRPRFFFDFTDKSKEEIQEELMEDLYMEKMERNEKAELYRNCAYDASLELDSNVVYVNFRSR